MMRLELVFIGILKSYCIRPQLGERH